MKIELCTTKRKFYEKLFEVIVPNQNVRQNFIVKIYFYLTTYLHKTSKLYGAYYPIKKIIFVNLERFNEFIFKNKLISEICNTITHESLHYAIDMCAGSHYRKLKYSEGKRRKNAEHGIIDFMMDFDLMKNGGKK